jgi:hypothetical protein
VVVKASPASTFIVIEAEFLLEFLIVALDPPAQFGSFHKGRQGCTAPSCGHSTSSHSSA